MAVSEKTIDRYFDLMQRFISVRPHFVAPEPLAHFKRELDSLSRGEGRTEDRTSVYRVLIILAQANAAPTMGEISTELGVPQSTATRIVDWLVAGAFVERVSDPADRRTVRIRMTAKGEQIYAAFCELNRQRIAHVLRAFSATEQAQLLKLMNRLLDSFQAEGPHSAGKRHA
jgi:MarR family transcriptional regulator, negative regulator of the multidrug operon emrRAB